MSFRLVPESVTLNDLERRNGAYFRPPSRSRKPLRLAEDILRPRLRAEIG